MNLLFFAFIALSVSTLVKQPDTNLELATNNGGCAISHMGYLYYEKLFITIKIGALSVYKCQNENDGVIEFVLNSPPWYYFHPGFTASDIRNVLKGKLGDKDNKGVLYIPDQQGQYLSTLFDSLNVDTLIGDTITIQIKNGTTSLVFDQVRTGFTPVHTVASTDKILPSTLTGFLRVVYQNYKKTHVCQNEVCVACTRETC